MALRGQSAQRVYLDPRPEFAVHRHTREISS
jgi:hypothetical protein